MTKEKQLSLPLDPKITFVEGPADDSGLISTMRWHYKEQHGSFLLREPYRDPKTAEELQSIGMSHINIAEVVAT